MTRDFVVPDPDAVLADLRPLTDLLWPALEEANRKALVFFDEASAGEARRWCAGTHAGLTRYHLIPLLDSAGVAALEESGDPALFERIGLANNGICLLRGRYVIRVRKADDGRLPPPGSAAQEDFYAQQMSLPFNLLGMEEPHDPANFVVLWGVGSVDHALNDLVLVCPSATKEPYWYAKIAHPIMSLQPKGDGKKMPAGDFDEIVAVGTPAAASQE